MCNAHNHPPNCTCGWGQGSNFSFSSKFNSIFRNNSIQENYAYKVLEVFPEHKFSVTVPNALCPVCGEKVFFYQNNNGSRVFFDSLGKPWPKHPCTDKEGYSTKDGKRGNIYSKDDFCIPEFSKEKKEVIQKNIKIFDYNSFYFFVSKHGKNMLKFNGNKYLLEEDLCNSPDIKIIVERNKELYLETYEIFSEESQQIRLIPKIQSDFENLKHFGIDDDEILTVSINYSEFSIKKICEVSILHYDIKMKMKIENFLDQSQHDIKYLKYLNKEKNRFKVKIRNGKLFEIE